jgi:hypothetical protein
MGSSARNMTDGRCVNTMALMSPKRLRETACLEHTASGNDGCCEEDRPKGAVREVESPAGEIGDPRKVVRGPKRRRPG